MIDILNSTTVYIEAYYNNECICPAATGFFYEWNSKKFLITNWHVVTGRHFETKKTLHNMAAVPNKICGSFLAANPHNNKELKLAHIDLPLYGVDETPIWFVHPKHNSNVDIVAIPLHVKQPPDIYNAIQCVNNLNSREEINFSIGAEVFILGFTKGISKCHLPVWKKASVATEPSLPYYEKRSSFLVDTATREGMSGAPVLIHASTVCTKYGPWTAIQGKFTKFLGIYSGRLGDKEVEAQLGIVWQETLIREVIEGQYKQPQQ